MNKTTTCLATLLLSATLTLLHASQLYWDTNSDTPGFGTASGTWGEDAFWSTDSDGTSIPDITDTTTDDDLNFGTQTQGLPSGTITIDGDTQGFKSLSFGAASGTLTLSGGSLLLNEYGSFINALNAQTTINTALIGEGDLSIKAIDDGMVLDNLFLSTTPTLVASNATLSDFDQATAFLYGTENPLEAYGFHFSHTSPTTTFQINQRSDSTLYSIKVELEQVGSDIYGAILYAKQTTWVDEQPNINNNFDSLAGIDTTIAPDSSSSGINISRLTLHYANTHKHPGFLSASPTVVIENEQLSNITAIHAFLGGRSISNSQHPATPYHFTNDGTTCTVQLQIFNGTFTKCDLVELAQSGSDITAKIVKAMYHDVRDSNVMGRDFINDTGLNVANGNIVTSFTSYGYGVFNLRFQTQRPLLLTANNTYSGNTTIQGGTVTLADMGLLGAGNYAGNIANYSHLTLNTSRNQTFSGNITGSGTLTIDNGTVSDEQIWHYDDTFLPNPSQSAILVAPLQQLSETTAVSGYLGGAYINNPTYDPIPAETFYLNFDLSANPPTATLQLQALDSDHTKCIKLRLTQTSQGITAKILYAKYLFEQHNLGYDFDQGGDSMGYYAHDSSSDGYGVAEITLTQNTLPLTTLSGINTYTGGTIIQSGRLMVTANKAALPTSGGIAVHTAGELWLNVSGQSTSSTGVPDNKPLTIKGGKLVLMADYNAGHNRHITIDGGILTSTIINDRNDAANYINKLTLSNGAQVLGPSIRAGYDSIPVITVNGNAPSLIENGINIVKRQSGTSDPLTFNVADVTNNADADLLINGTLRDYSSDLSGMPILKTGTGTLSLNAVNTTVAAYTITDGTILLQHDNAFNTNNNITLNGGAIDLSDTDNTCATLTLTDASSITLSTGTLAFADSSAIEWSEGATLTLSGELGSETLRFGTTKNALTPEQKKAIFYLGKTIELNSHGYVTTDKGGTMMIVK